MATSFQRTYAALRADRGRGPLVATLVAILVLSAWLAWAAGSNISIYRSSTRARIEVYPVPAHVAAPVAGKVVVAHFDVGAHVATNDVIVELDATPERIAVDHARTRVAALAPQIESVERELAAEDDARQHGGAADSSTEREAQARLQEAEADLGFAEQDFARERDLAERGASPEAARQRAEATLKQRRAALDGAKQQYEALTSTHREHLDVRRARHEQLERQQQELANALAAAKAEVARAEHELELRMIRAPLAGTLGELVPLRPGAVVHEADVVATIVPDGTLHVVAEFSPSALGRLAVGEPARVRLDGYPWTRYGTLGARVARIASEVREGTIRVELDLTERRAELPVRHGMTGTVDVEVEHTSPLTALSRAIGEATDRSDTP